MTVILLDGAELDIEDSQGDSTVGDLVNLVEDAMRESKRFVLELTIDGEEQGDWRNGEMLDTPLSSLKEVRIGSAPLNALMLEGLDTVSEYITLIKDTISGHVGELRQGVAPENPLSFIFSEINQIITTIDLLSKGGGKLKVDVFKSDPSVHYEGLIGHLESLKEAEDKGDSVLVADLLEYELTPYLEMIEECLFHGPNN